jgi:GAF domain-containing protein
MQEGVRPRGRLFRKYVVLIAGLVSGALLASGLVELYFSYRENLEGLVALQREQAAGAAARIEAFLRDIERQVGWASQSQVGTRPTVEQRRFEFIRLQRQAPAVTEVSQIDSAGREQLRVSRLAMDVVGSQADFSTDPRFKDVRPGRPYFGPVYFRKESEPYLTLSVAGGGDAGVTAAEVNLKFIWDVVSQIRIGTTGRAFVVDGRGQLVAHPDISLVLQKTDFSRLEHVRATLPAPAPGAPANQVTVAHDWSGRRVLTASAPIAPLGWRVFVEQPLGEALAPLYASAYRTIALLLAGVAFSVMASLVLARRMMTPIQALQAGAARIGAGGLDQRIDVKTGDELEGLADQFNRMAAQLHESYATLEQKVEDRTRELSEALEQQTATAEILRVISSSPTDIQPVLEAVAQSATRLCDAHDAWVARLEGDALRVVAHHGPIEPPDALTVTRGSVAGRTVIERRTLHVADLQIETDEYPEGSEIARRLGSRTTLSVPLLREGVPVGVLHIRRREVRSFSAKQIALLETFAAQAVIAIENVRLFQELEARNLELSEALTQQTATAEILRVISSSPTDIQPVLDAVAENAARVCGAYDAIIMRIDGDGLKTVAGMGPVPRLPEHQRLPLTHGSVAGRAVLERRTVHVHDLAAESEAEYPVAKARYRAIGVRTVLATPLLREGIPIGTIGIRRQEVRPFSDKQVKLLETFAAQAVIAIENVRLFQELDARNRELSEALEQQTATAEILRVISSSPTDVQPVLDAVADNAARLCDAPDVIILRLDGDALTIASSIGSFPTIIPPDFQVPINRGSVSGRAFVDRRTVHVHDLPSESDAEFPQGKAFARQFGHHTMLATPLLREGVALGVIVILRTEVRPFVDKQVRLLEIFAAQAAIAIENVRLFQEVQARNRELSEALEQQTATGEILQVISSSPTDIQPTFDAIAASAVRLCEADQGSVLRFDGNLVHLVAHSGSPDDIRALQRIFPRPPDRGTIVGRSILTGAVSQADILTDPEHGHRDLLGFFRTVLSVPMVRDGAPIGAIAVNRREDRPFSAKQTALLETFAAQAVIAIENVRLFQELDARNRDLSEALEQQTATAEILRVISSSPTDLTPVFDTILDKACALSEAQLGAVFRLDGETLEAAAWRGVGREFADLLRTRQYRVGRPMFRPDGPWHPVHIEDVTVTAAMQDPQLVEIVGKEGVRTVLGVPLVREGQLVGSIMMYRREVRPFSEKQIQLVATFATQAVIAIQNARLFQELQARTQDLARSVEQLQALGAVGQAVSSTLDLETVLTTIVSRADLLAGADGGAIYEYDEAARIFRLRATQRLGDEFVEAARNAQIEIGEGAVGQAALTRHPVAIADIRDPGAYEGQMRDAMRRAEFRAVLAVPLLREGRILGGLVVVRKTPGHFAPEVVDLLKTLAAQSAIAIQNARLFSELEDKSRELEAASRHKSEFLSNMSHELRTPLNAIIGFSEVLGERMFGELNDKQAEYVQDILSSGRHLLALINDILDLSKIEAGRMELELSRFDLPAAIGSAVILVRERATRHGLGLDVAVDDRLGLFVGDERKIRQVLLNLLSNAVKFTPEGGRITVRAAPANGGAEISVSDTGIGIAPDDQELIFQEFRQVGTDYARKREGTGLGLALARRFVDLHGGRLWVKSQPGEGSTFTFHLPVRPWPTS